MNQLHWLDQLHQVLEVGNYGRGTIKSYMVEMRLLFHYYYEKDVEQINEQHILPKRYTKIRHYGYLKNYKRTERLKQLFELLKLPPAPPKVLIPMRQRMLEKYGKDIMLCPKCEKSQMEFVATYRKGVLCKTYETNEVQHNNNSP